MNLRKAKRLKVGDVVRLQWPSPCQATITAVVPDPDPRVRLLFSVQIKDAKNVLHSLNYSHIKALIHAD